MPWREGESRINIENLAKWPKGFAKRMNHLHEELINTAPPGGEVCKVILIIRV